MTTTEQDVLQDIYLQNLERKFKENSNLTPQQIDDFFIKKAYLLGYLAGLKAIGVTLNEMGEAIK